jgi:hypothetical protein
MKRMKLLPQKKAPTRVSLFTPDKAHPAVGVGQTWVEQRSGRVATIIEVDDHKVVSMFDPDCLLSKRVHSVYEFRTLYSIR